MSDKRQDDQFSNEEATRRRDEVIRRMANTPPQAKPKKARESKSLRERGRAASAIPKP